MSINQDEGDVMVLSTSSDDEIDVNDTRHAALERTRRKELGDFFQQLQDILPTSTVPVNPNEKISKKSILVDAVQTIRNLKIIDARLELNIEKEVQNYQKLMNRLKMLEQQN